MRVYLDLVLALNFAVNYSLLRAAGMLTGYTGSRWRLGLGAALGAGYAVACLLPGFGFLSGNLWRAVFLGLMAWAAYGSERSLLCRVLLILLMSFAMGGAAACLRLATIPGLLLLGGSFLLGSRYFRSHHVSPMGRVVPASVSLGQTCLHLSALRDTGNTLCDPFSGESVLVVQKSAAESILGDLDLQDPAGALEQLRGRRPELAARLIPFHALGGRGLLLAVRCDRVTVDGREQGHYVAFTPEKLSGRGEYEALTGGA